MSPALFMLGIVVLLVGAGCAVMLVGGLLWLVLQVLNGTNFVCDKLKETFRA